MWFSPLRIVAAVGGAAVLGLGAVSIGDGRSDPPRLPEPVILERVTAVPGRTGPPASTGAGDAEPVSPCLTDDWDEGDDVNGADTTADSADSADSVDCECDDWDDWDDCD